MLIFLSHNSADKPIAERIAAQLTEHGLEVWFDKWEIVAGESLSDRIEDGLKRASAFLILMSPNSMSSHWVREELRAALDRRRKEPDFRLIPVLLQACDIPPMLADYKYVDWQKDEAAAIVAIIAGIKHLTYKPSPTPTIEPRFTVLDGLYDVAFSGDRGALAVFTEKFRMRAQREVLEIDRELETTGTLEGVEVSGLSLERKSLTPYRERWKLRPLAPIPKGADFAFEVTYRIVNGFTAVDNLWTYAIESPTDKLTAVFDFSKASPIATFAVHHRIGATLHPEPTKPIVTGSKFTWVKLLPEYRDTYEFHFAWIA
jgi:hypothetical protein